MKKLFTVFLLFATLMANAQVLYSFTTQSSDFQTTAKGSYKVIENGQSSGFTTQVGAPQLPTFIKKLVLPAGSIVTNIVIGNQNEELINNDILLFPTL